VAERGSGRQMTGPEPTGDASTTAARRMGEFRAAMRSAGLTARLILAIGALAGLLLVLTEFTTVAQVELTGFEESCESRLAVDDDADRCTLSGFERHGGAFAVLGILAVVMAWGAGVGGSRPAAAALVAIGLIVIVWALAFDLPETKETGAIGRNFDGAEAHQGPGLYLELIGGALALLAGLRRLQAGPEPQ
jgi:hypothetical protein